MKEGSLSHLFWTFILLIFFKEIFIVVGVVMLFAIPILLIGKLVVTVYNVVTKQQRNG